jgi:hypothetical protein
MHRTNDISTDLNSHKSPQTLQPTGKAYTVICLNKKWKKKKWEEEEMRRKRTKEEVVEENKE